MTKQDFCKHILNIRKEQNISQQNLEEMSGVNRQVISRIEINKTDPQLSTILKILKPLGKTLSIVSIENN